MPSITIQAASTPEDIRAFVDVAWDIHRNHPLWVGPVKSQERALLTPGAHPFWENAEGQCFIARRGNQPVGRIAAVVDRNYNAFANEQCGAWGFFECQNDADAAHALFAAASAWHAERGMTYMRGPLNPSTNYTCGMLVEGFDKPPALMMPWNPQYYPTLVESWHMRKEQDLLAYEFYRDLMDQFPAELVEQVAAIKARGEFTWRTPSKATLEADIRTMLDIYQESWSQNWGFTPMPLAEAQRHVQELKRVLDPDFFLLFYADGKPAGGMIALPNMNPLLKRCKGELGLSAAWHWWRSRAEVRQGYRLLLFGIREAYRLLGLPLLLLDALLERAHQRPELQWVEGSWSLEDNVTINDLIEDFGGVLTKRYRIYRRDMPC